MGEQLEVQWLADECYLVQSNDSTKWQSKARKLTRQEWHLVDKMEGSHRAEMRRLLATFKEVK